MIYDFVELEEYQVQQETSRQANHLFKTSIKGGSMESIHKSGNYKTEILFKKVINIPAA